MDARGAHDARTSPFPLSISSEYLVGPVYQAFTSNCKQPPAPVNKPTNKPTIKYPRAQKQCFLYWISAAKPTPTLSQSLGIKSVLKCGTRILS